MLTKYFLPIVAICGAIFAVMYVRAGNKPVAASQPVAQPAQAPYVSYVAGAGIIESSTENIAVGTVVPGVVTDLYAKIGDKVKAGQPLFKLDTRDLEADLVVRQSEVEAGRANVKAAEATLADVKNQWASVESMGDTRAVSKEESDRRRYAVDINAGRLAQAQAQVISAEAQVKAAMIEIDRRTVRAPVDATVLQVKIHLGEYAMTGVLATPLMLLGNIDTLVVRVDVDENDAWRVQKSIENASKAKAFVRGNQDLNTEVKFERVEPFVVPKRSLTGDSTERVDTRVLQVLYSFNRTALPVFVGQQMDVFIEAPPIGAAIPSPTTVVSQ